MLINESHVLAAVGSSNLRYVVQFNHLVAPWLETGGPMDLVALRVLSSLHVLLNTMVVLVLAFYCRNSRHFDNSGYFIINLAITDLVGFVMLFISLLIQQSIWNEQSDYELFDPLTYSTQLRSGCQMQMGLLTFSYLNTVFATGCLTVDRYVFITRPMRYKAISGSTINIYQICDCFN